MLNPGAIMTLPLPSDQQAFVSAPDLERALSPRDAASLVRVVQELSVLQDVSHTIATVRDAARERIGADGVAFVLKEGEQVYYADESAFAPLWKGRRFALDECISGWAIRHKQAAVIDDIYADPRLLIEAYRGTFVKSLMM